MKQDVTFLIVDVKMSRHALGCLLLVVILTTSRASAANSETVLFRVQPIDDDVRLRITPDARPHDNYVLGWLSKRYVLDVVESTTGYDSKGRRREWYRVVERSDRHLTGWIARSVVDTVGELPVPAAPPTSRPVLDILGICAACFILVSTLLGFTVVLIQRQTAIKESHTAAVNHSRAVNDIPHHIPMKAAAEERIRRANVVDFERAHDERDVRARLGIPERRTQRRTSISG